MNIRGLNTEPWGTPEEILNLLEGWEDERFVAEKIQRYMTCCLTIVNVLT